MADLTALSKDGVQEPIPCGHQVFTHGCGTCGALADAAFDHDDYERSEQQALPDLRYFWPGDPGATKSSWTRLPGHF